SCDSSAARLGKSFLRCRALTVRTSGRLRVGCGKLRGTAAAAAMLKALALMAIPRKVSRSRRDRFGGFAWNAFVDLCAMEPIDALTPVQRVAHLAFWYMSEVNNGGHFQYFCNQEHLNHCEVVTALRQIGASGCALLLSEAIALHDTLELE